MINQFLRAFLALTAAVIAATTSTNVAVSESTTKPTLAETTIEEAIPGAWEEAPALILVKGDDVVVDITLDENESAISTQEITEDGALRTVLCIIQGGDTLSVYYLEDGARAHIARPELQH